MLCANSTDALWRAIGDTHTHSGKAGLQAALRSWTLADLPPLPLFEHGMGGSGI